MSIEPADTDSIPIIDTHIHLFDPRRPQGIPWPEKDDELLYKPALPHRYQEVTRGMNIVGAIEVECSTRLEDNQWVLDTAIEKPIIVGTVGNLEPGQPDFRKHLERFHRNPVPGKSDTEICGIGILASSFPIPGLFPICENLPMRG
jgi:L-fuconolactonase